MGASDNKTQIRRGRRRFLIAGVLVTGGLVVGIDFATRQNRLGDSSSLKPAHDNDFVFNAWIKIDNEGIVTVAIPRTEMGQGVYTALAQLVADELDADWSKVRVEQAPIDKVYANIVLANDWISGGEPGDSFLNKRMSGLFAMQITGGSSSVRDAWGPMRKAGAIVRNMMLQSAAHYWDVPAEDCDARDGALIHLNSGRRLSFGEIAPFAAYFEPDESVQPKDTRSFNLIGRSLPRLDIPAKLNGTAKFGIDTHFPNMLYAASRALPAFGVTLDGYTASAVIGIPGVRAIVELDNAVAVVATSYWKAKNAVETLPITYDEEKRAKWDDARIERKLLKALDSGGTVHESIGDPDSDSARAGQQVSADYHVPFLAHACMEPMNATARIDDDGCELWSGTQAPDLARKVAASIAGIPESDVRVHTPFVGGGFGRRAEMDAVAQVVKIAMGVRGTPVKLVFSREQDMKAGVYRPVAAARLQATLGPGGTIESWTQRIASPSAARDFGKRWIGFPSQWAPDHSVSEGAVKLPYFIPNRRVEVCDVETPVPVGFWRSVAHSYNAFFKECFIDELAHAANTDPLQFRLALLAGNSRHKTVLQRVAEAIRWQEPRKDGMGLGIAVHESFGSVVAQAIEVEAAIDGSLRLHRLVCAVDCGLAVHPDGVKAQIEGGAIFGLSAALFGNINIEKGGVSQSNFHDYPILNLAQTPPIETIIVESTETPAGVGEIAVPPAAPALVNAIFAATGKRIRRLPLSAEGFSLA